MTKILLVLSCILISMTTDAQNVIELETTALGRVPFSINNITRPVGFIGINYLKEIKPHLYGIAGFGGMHMTYFDNCNNCADHFSGTTALNSWQTSLGIRYMFREGINYYQKTWKERFDYFVEINAIYQDINTKGDYMGGLGGGILISNNDYHGIGGALKFGGIYKISPNLFTGVNAAFYVSRGRNKIYSDNYYTSPDFENISDAVILLPIEIRLGYSF